MENELLDSALLLKEKLTQICSEMEGKDTAKILLEKPELGHFLSQACKSKELLSCKGDELYDLLTHSILILSKIPLPLHYAPSGIERRALAWGMGQLHNMMYNGYFEQEKALMYLFDIQPQEFNKALLEEVNTEFFVPKKDDLLRSGISITSDTSLLEMTRLAEKQDAYYQVLPDQMKIHAWINSRSLFEKEVVSLLHSLMVTHRFLSHSQVKDTLDGKKPMVEACAVHQKLCWYAFELFRYGIDTCEVVPPSLSIAASCLAEKIRCVRSGHPKYACFTLLYQDNLRILPPGIVMLRNLPEVLSVESAEHFICKAAADVVSIAHNKEMSLLYRFHLHLARPLVEVAVILVLFGTERVLRPCLQMIVFFVMGSATICDEQSMERVVDLALLIRQLKNNAEAIIPRIFEVMQRLLTIHGSFEKLRNVVAFSLTLTTLHHTLKGDIFKDLFLRVSHCLPLEEKLDVLVRSLESTRMHRTLLAKLCGTDFGEDTQRMITDCFNFLLSEGNSSDLCNFKTRLSLLGFSDDSVIEINDE